MTPAKLRRRERALLAALAVVQPQLYPEAGNAPRKAGKGPGGRDGRGRLPCRARGFPRPGHDNTRHHED